MGKKKKALYTGIFLDNASQVRVICAIQRYVGETHVNKFAHHLTLKFKPIPEEVRLLPVGSEISFVATGYGADSKAQALVCTLPPGLTCANESPHVTVATADGTKPVYSNELLTHGHTQFDRPLPLMGRVGWFDGRNVRYDFEGSIYE